MGILGLILLREEVEEDVMNTAHTKCSLPNAVFLPLPAPPNTEFLQFPAQLLIFWSYVTSSEESQMCFTARYIKLKNNEVVRIGMETILRLQCRSYLIGCHHIILLNWFGLGSPNLQ